MNIKYWKALRWVKYWDAQITHNRIAPLSLTHRLDFVSCQYVRRCRSMYIGEHLSCFQPCDKMGEGRTRGNSDRSVLTMLTKAYALTKTAGQKPCGGPRGGWLVTQMNNTKIRADVKTITAPTWTQIHTGISKAQGFTKAAWVMKIRNNKPWSCSCTAVFRHNRIQEWLLLPWVTLTSADHFGVLNHNLVKSKYNLFLSSSARIIQNIRVWHDPFLSLFHVLLLVRSLTNGVLFADLIS